jgi:hypothetical protein
MRRLRNGIIYLSLAIVSAGIGATVIVATNAASVSPTLPKISFSVVSTSTDPGFCNTDGTVNESNFDASYSFFATPAEETQQCALFNGVSRNILQKKCVNSSAGYVSTMEFECATNPAQIRLLWYADTPLSKIPTANKDQLASTGFVCTEVGPAGSLCSDSTLGLTFVHLNKKMSSSISAPFKECEEVNRGRDASQGFDYICSKIEVGLHWSAQQTASRRTQLIESGYCLLAPSTKWGVDNLICSKKYPIAKTTTYFQFTDKYLSYAFDEADYARTTDQANLSLQDLYTAKFVSVYPSPYDVSFGQQCAALLGYPNAASCHAANEVDNVLFGYQTTGDHQFKVDARFLKQESAAYLRHEIGKVIELPYPALCGCGP